MTGVRIDRTQKPTIRRASGSVARVTIPGAPGVAGPAGGPIPVGGAAGEYPTPDGDGGFEWVRPVRPGELGVNLADYVVGDGTADDTAATQAAATEAETSGVALYAPDHLTVKLTGSINVGSGFHVHGGATFLVSMNDAAFNVAVGAVRVRFNGIRFVGTLPGDDVSLRANEVGIEAFSTWDNPVRDLLVEACTFEGISGTCVRIKHVDGFRIRRNKMIRNGYAGAGCLSVRNGWIENNEIEGASALPSFSPNAYGAYVSTLEADGDVGTTQNPRSTDVIIQGNIVRNQLWAGLNSHVGQRISFIGNQILDCLGNGISASYIDSGGHAANALLGAPETTITGNTIVYSDVISPASPPAALRAGIMLRGSVSSNVAAREKATGSITNNHIYRMGTPASTTSGAILLGTGSGVVIANNEMYECRCSGINLIDSVGTTIGNNTIVDLWREAGTPVAVRVTMTHETTMDMTLTGNKMLRGRLVIGTDIPADSSVNTSVVNGTNTAAIVVNDNGNDWGEGNPSWASQITRQQRLTLNRRMVDGTAAPTTGTWLTGDQVRNTTPTSGGWLGWICTNGGTPGTWRGFGAIAAS